VGVLSPDAKGVFITNTNSLIDASEYEPGEALG
jgi:hypothetical protein